MGLAYTSANNPLGIPHWHILPCHEGFKMPTRGTPSSVGFDLYAPEGGFIAALDRRLIRLGFKASFADNWMALFLDRSGMANKGQARLGGVIDPDYRDEWKVILYNTTSRDFHFNAGDRLVQVVFLPIGTPTPELVSQLEASERSGGFGSTGK